MKLEKGVTVRHLGQTHRDKCPDGVAEAVGLKASDKAVPLKPKKEVKP